MLLCDLYIADANSDCACFAGGTYIALFVVLLVDFVGLEKLNQASGLAIMCLGIFNMPMPMLIGDACSFESNTCRIYSTVSPLSTNSVESSHTSRDKQ